MQKYLQKRARRFVQSQNDGLFHEKAAASATGGRHVHQRGARRYRRRCEGRRHPRNQHEIAQSVTDGHHQHDEQSRRHLVHCENSQSYSVRF